MNIIDLRKSQDGADKKATDRRQNPHPFGSAEWREYIEQRNLVCPTEDRRKMNRRATDTNPQDTNTTTDEKPYVRIELSAAEKKLLEDLLLDDEE